MPAAARRTQKERTEATVDRLLAATVDCLAELGYARCSTPEICRRAGVSRGAQLHHFPTKAELVAAAVERVFERRHEEFRRFLAEAGEVSRPADAFTRLWDIYAGPTFYAWIELVIAARTDPALLPHVAGVNARFFAQAQNTFRLLAGERVSDAHVAGATRMLLSVFDGLAMSHILERDEERVAAVFEALEALITPLLAPRGEAP